MLYLKKDNLINAGLFIVSVILLLWPAIENGYPLVFSDSATYMISGHTGHVPIDRPITYGLYVRHLSLSYSMWFIVMLQSVVVNYILLLFVKFFSDSKRVFFVHFVIISLLAYFTGIDYYTSFLVPDIFASVAILALFLLFFLKRQHPIHLCLVSLIFCLAIIFHLSHIPLALAVFMVVGTVSFILNVFDRRYLLIRASLIFGLFLISILSLMLINIGFGAGFKISRSNNVVFAARLIESGLVNEYLSGNCGNQDFQPSYLELCKYVDQFDNWPAAGFYLWVEDSPLYAGGCAEKGWENCWIVKDQAYGDLIKDVMNEPGNLKEMAALSIVGTLKQLITFEQVKLDPVDLRAIVEKYYEDDLFSYLHSAQAKESIYFQEQSLLEALIFDISIILSLLLFFKYWSQMDRNNKLLLLMVLSTLLINAFICATLSNVVPRYQGRIAYLLPLSMIWIYLKIYKKSSAPKILDISQII